VAPRWRLLIASAHDGTRNPDRSVRRGRLQAAAGSAIHGSARTLGRLRTLNLVTGIFEKELLLLLYYLVFSFIAGAFPAAALQGAFFTAGTLCQALLKIFQKVPIWNNFILFLFYLAGTLANHGRNTLGYGLLGFVLLVSCISALYEYFRPRLERPLLIALMGMAHSAVVFMAFPLLYSLFLLKKKDLSLGEFFQEKEHFLVFLGYSTFYVSVVINKQLLSIQNNLLRKWCRQNPGQDRGRGEGSSP